LISSCHRFSPTESQRVVEQRSIGVAAGYGSLQVTQAERIDNPLLKRRFKERQKAIARLRGLRKAKVKVAFHGTRNENIPSIVKNALRTEYLGRHTGDRGWYGAGCYLTPRILYAGEYASSAPILLFDVLPGRVDTAAEHPRDEGTTVQAGYDSHRSPCGQEWVFFDSDQLLPRYIITICDLDDDAQVVTDTEHEDGCFRRFLRQLASDCLEHILSG
jgi:hypothetical protein